MGEPQQRRLDTVTAIAETNQRRIEQLENRIEQLEKQLKAKDKIKLMDCKWLKCEPWEMGGC